MCEVQARTSFVDDVVVEWRRLSKGQKKFVLVMSLPVSMMVMVLAALGFILSWSAGELSANYMFGNPSDAFLTLVYGGILKAMDHWLLVLTPLLTTPCVLGYIEYKSRRPAH